MFNLVPKPKIFKITVNWFLLFFNWWKNVLHFYLGSCHRTMWISHNYIYTHTHTPFPLEPQSPPPSPSRSSQIAWLGSLCYLVTSYYFTHDSVYIFEKHVIFPLDMILKSLVFCLPGNTGDVWWHFWLSHWERGSAPGIQEVKTGMVLSVLPYTGQALQEEPSAQTLNGAALGWGGQLAASRLTLR